MAARSLILLALVACAGPVPSVDHIAVIASPLPGHVRVTGELVNRGGHGDVELVITLRGPSTIRADQMIDVKDGEHLSLAIDVAAPAGAYTATVDAEYPN